MDLLETELKIYSFFRVFKEKFSFPKTFKTLFFSKLIIVLVIVFTVISLAFNFFLPRNKASKNTNIKAGDTPLVRGIEGDFWADYVIGQKNFLETSEFKTVNNKVFNPGGVIIDRTDPNDNKIYVWDAGNNRILGFHLNKCLSKDTNIGCEADIVIGQPDFNSSSCNGDSSFQSFPNRALPSEKTLCGLPPTETSPGEGGSYVNMDVDAEGNLYVPDFYNNRVLKFNKPFETDTIADDVWGQDDFSGFLRNKGQAPNASSFQLEPFLLKVAGVGVDEDLNLWVADTHNHRVLRFPKGLKQADLVLGQNDFSSKQPGSNLNNLNEPAAVRVIGRGENQKIFVVDYSNNRVLVFSYPFSNGMTGNVFGRGFYRVSGIEIDPNNEGIWISDTRDAGRGMIELWNFEGTEVKKFLGQSQWQVHSNNEPGNSIFMENFGSIGISSHGILCTSTRWGQEKRDNNILCFDLQSETTDSPQKPDYYFFAPENPSNKQTGANLITRSSFGSVRSLIHTNDQLITLDTGRVLFWNDKNNLSGNVDAGGVINFDSERKFFVSTQPEDFTKRNSLWATNLTADKKNHLYLITKLFEILIYDLPLTNSSVPISRIKFCNSGTCLSFISGEKYAPGGNFEVGGIAVTPDGKYLYFTDSDASRVLRIRDPLDENKRVIDLIIGQKDIYGTSCNQKRTVCTGHWCHGTNLEMSDDSLCLPGLLSLDNFNNLYISDNSIEMRGNSRLMIFRDQDLPKDNTELSTGISAYKIFKEIEPLKVAFDSKNRMFVGFNPHFDIKPPISSCPKSSYGNSCHFVAFYQDPLNPEKLVPDGYLNDYFTMPYSAAFDKDDNLYVGDLNRSRILIFKNPLKDLPNVIPSPYPTAISKPTPVTPTISPIPTGVYPTPAFCRVSINVSQEKGTLRYSFSSKVKPFVYFQPKRAGLLVKIQIKGGGWSRGPLTIKKIFCWVTDEEGKKIVAPPTVSEEFNSSSQEKWITVVFMKDYVPCEAPTYEPYVVEDSQKYRLYCSTQENWLGVYWIYEKQNDLSTKTFRIYTFPSSDYYY